MDDHADGWAPRGLLVEIPEGHHLVCCSHCDRYPEGHPLKHPSCLIVKDEPDAGAATADGGAVAGRGEGEG